MNKVFMIGRLTKDPETRVTQTGKKVTSFSIALNEGKSAQGNDLVSYFNMSAWEKTADIIENYARKGTKVAVVGRLQNRSWDKPDGTKGYATDIVVSELELLSGRSDAAADGEASAPGVPAATAPKPYTAPASDANAARAKKKQDDDTLPEIDVDSMNVQMPF